MLALQRVVARFWPHMPEDLRPARQLDSGADMGAWITQGERHVLKLTRGDRMRRAIASGLHDGRFSFLAPVVYPQLVYFSGYACIGYWTPLYDTADEERFWACRDTWGHWWNKSESDGSLLGEQLVAADKDHDFRSAVEQLESADAHAGNWGMAGDQPVLFDPWSPYGGRIPDYEVGGTGTPPNWLQSWNKWRKS